MGFLDFLIKPLTSFLDIITFGKLDTEKIINDGIGIALGFTKIGTPLQLFENITDLHILPDKVGKSRIVGTIIDDLGLGRTFVGTAVHKIEDNMPINILQDNLKNAVREKKNQWMNELKGMKFHNEQEITDEINRRVLEEKKYQEQLIINSRQVEKWSKEGKTNFMVANIELLDDKAKNAYNELQKSEGDKWKKYYLEQEIQKKKDFDDKNKQRFYEDFIMEGHKKQILKDDRNFMGWFNQTKQYYKL